MKLIERLFSVKNKDARKIITILGCKLKIKNKNLILSEKIKQLSLENQKVNEQLQYLKLNINNNRLLSKIKTIALLANKDLINKNKHARICIVLHLFYMESFNQIREYLDNLSPYNYDLIVTCIKGFYDEKTLEFIKIYKPDTKIYYYENKGFDIGPFIDVLNHINLEDYDMVFKLHSKGMHRPFIYIYHQIFKYEDWFYNLYDGILGEYTIHRVIDKLLNAPDIGLVAAENLIVNDPKHKVKFTQDIAATLNIKLADNYKFVAGSCFAISAECLNHIKDLNLTIESFDQTERGIFSFAHAMERIVCAIPALLNKKLYGIPVYYNNYVEELHTYEKYNTERLLKESDFSIDYDFFYKVLEMRKVSEYKIKTIALKDIKRLWHDGKIYTLSETSPYQFLSGNKEKYIKYCQINKEISGFDMSVERYENLISSFDKGTFNEKYLPIVDSNNILMDGQHRCCIMLNKYGEEHKIKVLELTIK